MDPAAYLSKMQELVHLTGGELRQWVFLRIEGNRALRHLTWHEEGLQSPRPCWTTNHGSEGAGSGMFK